MLILMVHGSRNPDWRGSVEEMTAAVQQSANDTEVRLAYMECAPPTLMEVVTEAVESGVKQVRVLPLFLASEGHVDRNVRPLVDEVRDSFAELDIELLPALGRLREFREFLTAIAMRQAE